MNDSATVMVDEKVENVAPQEPETTPVTQEPPSAPPVVQDEANPPAEATA